MAHPRQIRVTVGCGWRGQPGQSTGEGRSGKGGLGGPSQ
jgi:hypothetical protein